MRAFAESANVKLGKVAQPLRAALTGRTTSPGIFDVLAVLGKAESLARIRDQATVRNPGRVVSRQPCLHPFARGCDRLRPHHLAVRNGMGYAKSAGPFHRVAGPLGRSGFDRLTGSHCPSARRGYTMDAKTGAKTAKLSIGDESHNFPVKAGTIGPEVIDIAKLYATTGMFTYDPGFTSTASCESKITYIDGDEGILLYRGYPIEQLAEHGDFLETCYLLLYGELPTATQKADFDNRVTRPHHGARADEPLLPGLPPRRASDGGDGGLGRRAVGLLSRLHRHLRSASAHGRLDPHDREDADARRDGLQVLRSASPSCIRRTLSTTPRTSCTCASRCRARNTRRTRCWRARWTASSSCMPITSRTPRPRRCGSPAPRAPIRSPASRPASPASGARRMAAPTKPR